MRKKYCHACSEIWWCFCLLDDMFHSKKQRQQERIIINYCQLHCTFDRFEMNFVRNNVKIIMITSWPFWDQRSSQKNWPGLNWVEWWPVSQIGRGFALPQAHSLAAAAASDPPASPRWCCCNRTVMKGSMTTLCGGQPRPTGRSHRWTWTWIAHHRTDRSRGGCGCYRCRTPARSRSGNARAAGPRGRRWSRSRTCGGTRGVQLRSQGTRQPKKGCCSGQRRRRPDWGQGVIDETPWRGTSGGGERSQANWRSCLGF